MGNVINESSHCRGEIRILGAQAECWREVSRWVDGGWGRFISVVTRRIGGVFTHIGVERENGVRGRLG